MSTKPVPDAVRSNEEAAEALGVGSATGSAAGAAAVSNSARAAGAGGATPALPATLLAGTVEAPPPAWLVNLLRRWQWRKAASQTHSNVSSQARKRYTHPFA